jgi:hypothetical protein
MADNARGAWSMRTVLDLHQGRTRNDLLFTMSNNTRTPRRTRTGANLFSLLDEQGVPDGNARERLVAAACAGGRYAAADRAAINRPHWLGPHDPGTCDRQSGGARRDRTDDLLLAKQALSQLSYGPFRDQKSVIGDQESRP